MSRPRARRQPHLAITDTVEADNLTYFAFLEKPPKAATQAKPEVLPPPPPLPDTLGGRYALERMIGAGGMGTVYRARDLLREQFGDPDPYVAVKLLNDEFAEYPDASALLYSEFALTVRLRHPNIVRLHDFEVDNEYHRAFITLELMRGVTLDQLLCERPHGMPWSESGEISAGLLAALAYSHERGILHGDLKPSNVMLAEDGPRLFDYGLGQALEGLLDGLPRLSRDRISAWTPRYAALELLDGAALSTSTDLYAIACVIYELLTGQHPYRRLTARQARAMELEKEIKAPAQIPPHAWKALRCSLALEVGQRQICVNELREAFLSTPAKRFGRWFQRRNE